MLLRGRQDHIICGYFGGSCAKSRIQAGQCTLDHNIFRLTWVYLGRQFISPAELAAKVTMLVGKINFFHLGLMERHVSGGPHSPKLAAKCYGLQAVPSCPGAGQCVNNAIGLWSQTSQSPVFRIRDQISQVLTAPHL